MKTIADSPDSRKYETGWDVLRVLACLMVIVIHARNPYTYGADGALDPWAAFFIVAARAGVPLFVMLSCALLLPLRQGAGDFLKRRFWRVAAPFAVWSAIFAFIPLPADLTGYAPVYEGLTPPAGAPLWQEALFRRLASRSFAIFLVHWLFAVYGWGFFAGLGLPAWLGMPALTAAIFLCSWAVAEALALLPRPAARLLGID